MAFMTLMVTGIRTGFCLGSKLTGTFSAYTLILTSLLSSASIMIENDKRMEDYVVFSLPRVIEGVWEILVQQGYAKNIPHGQSLLFAISLGLLLVFKKHYTKLMPSSYESQLSFFFGKEEEKSQNIEIEKENISN